MNIKNSFFNGDNWTVFIYIVIALMFVNFYYTSKADILEKNIITEDAIDLAPDFLAPDFLTFDLSISEAVEDAGKQTEKAEAITRLQDAKFNILGPKLYFMVDNLVCRGTFTYMKLKELDDIVKENDGLINDNLLEEYVWYFNDIAKDYKHITDSK